MEMAWLRHRSSVRWLIGIAVGCIGLLLGVFFYVYVVVGFGILIGGLSVFLLLLQLVIPSLVFRRVYRRNARMFGPRTVNISDVGIIVDHQLGHTESAWSMYEKFKETPRLFLLHQTPDIIGILPKRVFEDKNQLEHFRTLLNSKVRREP
jgi:hypothetical protein